MPRKKRVIKRIDLLKFSVNFGRSSLTVPSLTAFAAVLRVPVRRFGGRKTKERAFPEQGRFLRRILTGSGSKDPFRPGNIRRPGRDGVASCQWAAGLPFSPVRKGRTFL
jgi:hypothetical protein